ncbi:hypothetical protein EDB92DRAFT_1945739 [Lactarius akahatsu]|uniref:Uncharacterized protein n=1 Tax=Lactarius akahatsu TaxID=416441 RepID=A0AAD4LHL3_9AGAM|nr:hypothetical protein EDB92DRAFT_1945739 [Lactarius akahatsu]
MSPPSGSRSSTPQDSSDDDDIFHWALTLKTTAEHLMAVVAQPAPGPQGNNNALESAMTLLQAPEPSSWGVHSQAHGLDYYMGLIYKAIVEASALPGLKAMEKPNPAPAVPKNKSSVDKDEEIDESQVGVGLITVGGWYNNLVGMFTAAALSNGKKGAGLLPNRAEHECR